MVKETREELQKKIDWYEKRYGKPGVKSLFRKPTFSDVMVFVMLIGIICLGLFYYFETEQCRYTIRNLDDFCIQMSQVYPNESESTIPTFNLEENVEGKRGD